MTKPTDQQKKYYASAKVTTSVAVEMMTDPGLIPVAQLTVALANTYLRLAELDWMSDDQADKDVSDKVTNGIITGELNKFFNGEV